jgi:hypothetical protein
MRLKKILALGIIFLFIGVAVAPSINSTVVKASNDNDLVEVTSQACGIQGFGNTTVKLTKQQYQNLEQYLVDFRARLNQTTTREEAVPIFKEAVVELNKYGLLPKGMSVEEAEKLVTGGYLNKMIPKNIKSLEKKFPSVFSNNSNFFCLIGGNTNNTMFIGPSYLLMYPMMALGGFGALLVLLGKIILAIPFGVLAVLFEFLFLFFHSSFPIPMINYIELGDRREPKSPDEGWVNSIGKFGKKNWSGEFYGDIYFFSGLRIPLNPEDWWMDHGKYFYLGSALWANISYEPPQYK